ncbi:MAG: M20/M25/M40 family metallo-hydrolase [Candidatus Promineifilaceae bacterium]
MNQIERIKAGRAVQHALAALEAELKATIEQVIAIQQIPAPTFAESRRADHIQAQFGRLGLSDVSQDDSFNVYGRLPGEMAARPVVVTAHMDTVFPLGTDLSLKPEAGGADGRGRLAGPGLADNSAGVGGLLASAGALRRFHLRTVQDVWFVANTREEGLGNLSGMRAVVERFGREATYLVVEGGSFGHIYHQAVGVRRFRLEVSTAGGHSWGDFGAPSAIHVLCRLVADVGRLTLPAEPKTTYNAGLIGGGTGVNTIAASAECLLDLRSQEMDALEALVGAVEGLVAAAAAEPGVQVALTTVGDRPAGTLPRQAAPVALAAEALEAVGCQNIRFMAGSTDANIPISQGIPSVCVGLAESGNTHRLDEYIDFSCFPQGLQQLLLLILACAGYKDDRE